VVSFSVLIITHGREELLLKCLDSLRPSFEKWQLVIVANGLDISEKVLALAREVCLELDVLHLESKLTPGKARNEGIKLIKYDWTYMIDDDAYVYPQYFQKALPLLEQSRIDVLGGPDTAAKGMDHFSEALALALSSPFCTGKTFGRHKRKGRELIEATEEILTSCNLWIRSQLLHEVKFPEDYLRTEETALLIDLGKKGAHMYYHPELVVGHHRRKNFKSLFRPTFFAGYYRSKVLRDKKVKGALLFWAPALFVLLHLIIFIDLQTFWFLTRTYVGLIVLMSLNLASRRNKLSLFLYTALLHYFIVFVYGLGFISNKLRLNGNR
jgi:glycosyltransferase involved in cell wall biosynthesis